MSTFEHDPKRTAGCVARLRFAIRLSPWVLVPATSAILSLPGIPFGAFAMLLFAVIGVIAGFYLSAMIAAVLEWMALMLIAVDCRKLSPGAGEVE